MSDCTHPETYRFTLGATVEGQRCAVCGCTVEQWHRQVDPNPMLAAAVFFAVVLALVALAMVAA